MHAQCAFDGLAMPQVLTRSTWSIAVQMRYLLSLSSLNLGHTHYASLINRMTCTVDLDLALVTRQDRPPDEFNTFTPHAAKASALPSIIHLTPELFQQHSPQLHRCTSSLSYFHSDELQYHAFTAACYQPR